MNSFEVKVYPNTNKTNGNLGGGSILCGGLIAKFSIWENPKFDTGFAIGFPFKKDAQNKVHNEVYFLDKDLERNVYEQVRQKLAEAGVVPGSGGQPANNNYTPAQQVPQQNQQPAQISPAGHMGNSSGTPW